jgi:hypothetical protein
VGSPEMGRRISGPSVRCPRQTGGGFGGAERVDAEHVRQSTVAHRQSLGDLKGGG